MGSIEVILGSMYAEKSTELIRRVRRYEIAGNKCVVFKHSLDCQRSNKADIVTHNQNSYKAIVIESIDAIYKYIHDEYVDVIAIDEAQFFNNDIVQFARSMSQSFDRKVIIAGLDMDYQGNPFGSMGDLCCIADRITKLHAVCVLCGKDAKYSYRKTREHSIVSIGAADKYEALCEHCYLERMGKKWQ